MKYQAPRQRDAWFVIRGFVYQVQRTIELWIDLAPEDCLELECGEDIDLIANWARGAGTQDRLLEQIKRRETSLTLNSAEARAALANFIEHRASNPRIRLQFRYVSNASAGQEANPAMVKGQTGIRVWESARQKSRGDIARSLAAIRGLLRKGKRPRDTPVATWSKYREFLGRARYAEMVSLIADFKWSLTKEDAPELKQKLEKRIQMNGIATDSAQASQVYDHLFAHVFHILATKGTKRLTAPDLSNALAASQAGPADTRVWQRLETELEHLQQQIGEANQRLDGHDDAIAITNHQVAVLSRAVGISTSFLPFGPPPDLSAPLAFAASTPRTSGLSRIRSELASHAWVALHGVSGSGKTEVARQALVAIDAGSPWVTLRDQSPPSALATLQSALLTIGRVEPRRALSTEAYQDVALELGGKLLVVDDLPALQHGDDIANLLVGLAAAFKLRNARLLTTSAHTLPARLQTALGDLVSCLETPPFSNEETLELFRAFGAKKDNELPARAKFVTAVTRGHAELATTAVVHLKQRHWRFSEEVVTALLGSNLTAPIRNDVLRRIQGTVPNSDARELLYRSAVAIGSFDEDDLREIAACDPPVPRPGEALTQILGLWVQRQGIQRFSVCPLVNGLDSELAPEVRRCVHSKLGLRTMRQKTVGPLDVTCAIAHFLNADEFDRAGVAYLLALSSVDTKQLPAFDAGLFSMWTSEPLPLGMTRAIRIAIRSLQIGVLNASGRSIAYLAKDVFDLAESVREEDVSELAPTVSRAAELAAYDFGRTTTLIVRIVQAEVRGRLHTPDGKPFRLPRGLRFGTLFWHMTSFAGTGATVRLWIQALTEIGADFLESNSAGPAFEYGCVGLADRVWVTEASRSEHERNWAQALSLLDEVAQTGGRLGLAILQAAAVRAQVIIRAEYEKDLAGAEKVATAAMTEVSEPTAQFLIREVLGRQYLIAQRQDDAAKWLGSALTYDSSSLDHARFIAELSLAEAIANKAPRVALSSVLRALKLAREGEFPKTELVKALGEASIGTALAHGPATAFAYLDEALTSTLRARDESDAWKDLLVLLAHTVGYFQSLAETGNPPPGLTTDGEEFARPQQGLFLTNNPSRAALHSLEREAHVQVSMALFANAVHDDQRLRFWLNAVMDSPLAEQFPVVTSILKLFRIVEQVVEGNCAEAIECAKGSTDSPAGILHALLAVSIRIAHVSLEDSEGAAQIAQDAAKAMSPGDFSEPLAELRTVAADLLSLAATPTVRMRSFVEVAKQRGSHELVQYSAGVLASVFEGDLFPGQILALHVSLAMWLAETRMMNRHLHRRLYLPFLGKYWQSFASRSRFLLRSPSDVQQSLRDAAQVAVDDRAQAILSTMMTGLSVTCPEHVAKWLRNVGGQRLR